MSDDEFGIIAKYFEPIAGGGPGVTLGPGDDCAVLAVSPGNELCISTDTLVAGVHFPQDAEGELVATRCFGASVSDLAAMGAEPRGLTIALTIPAADHNWLAGFADGLGAALKDYNIALIGGNMANGPASVTVTVFGEVPAGASILRSGARPGDDVYVSGTIGDAGAGLQLALEGERAGFLVDRYVRPQPRCQLGAALRGYASAMIDVSDGLLTDAEHIASASSCSIEIDLDAVPFSDELLATPGFDAITAVTAGDDYELCFTAPPSARDSLAALEVGEVSRIGRVSSPLSTRLQVFKSGSPVAIDTAGFNHFGVSDER